MTFTEKVQSQYLVVGAGDPIEPWEAHKMHQARLKTTVDVGALMRKSLVDAIKSYCFKHEIKLEMNETKGFLSSKLQFVFVGKEEEVKTLQQWFENVMVDFK